MEQKQPSLIEIYAGLQRVELQLKKLNMLVEEDFELSDSAKKALKKAREIPESAYISLK